MTSTPSSWQQPPRSSLNAALMRMSQSRALTSCWKRTTSYRILRQEPQCPISTLWSSLCWLGAGYALLHILLRQQQPDTVMMHRPKLRAVGKDKATSLTSFFSLSDLNSFMHLWQNFATLVIYKWDTSFPFSHFVFCDVCRVLGIFTFTLNQITGEVVCTVMYPNTLIKN